MKQEATGHMIPRIQAKESQVKSPESRNIENKQIK